MFKSGNIVKGTLPDIGKPKYIISLYRDEVLLVLGWFATSKERAGVPPEELSHGPIKKNDIVISYFFDKNKEIGVNPAGERWSFPLNTVVAFDYGILENTQEKLLQNMENVSLECAMDKEEYLDFIYAAYHSPKVPKKFKPLLERVLHEEAS